MTRPTTYLIRMAVFLVLVAVAVGVLSPVLWVVFWHNPGLNSLILLVLAVGIAWNLRQVLRLAPEVAWLDHYRAGPDRLTAAPVARLLAPMARMLRPRQEDSEWPAQRRLTLSAGAMRSLLDSLASRLDESRELSRYMTGLLIFLGLLGHVLGPAENHRRGGRRDRRDDGGRRRRHGDVRSPEGRPRAAAARHGHRVLRQPVRSRRRADPGVSRPHRRPGAKSFLQ